MTTHIEVRQTETAESLAHTAYTRFVMADAERTTAALDCGKALVEAKARATHGTWGATLKRIGVPKQTAARWMRLARTGWKSTTVVLLGGLAEADRVISDVRKRAAAIEANEADVFAGIGEHDMERWEAFRRWQAHQVAMEVLLLARLRMIGTRIDHPDVTETALRGFMKECHQHQVDIVAYQTSLLRKLGQVKTANVTESPGDRNRPVGGADSASKDQATASLSGGASANPESPPANELSDIGLTAPVRRRAPSGANPGREATTRGDAA